jgi:hypothetical protein
MTKPVSTRAFGILDMIVLIAATALAFGLLRFMGANGCLFRTESIVPDYTYRAQCGYELAFPFLWAWTLAFLILRLRGPRPRLKRLARQPGMAACSAAALALAVPMLAIIISQITSSVQLKSEIPDDPSPLWFIALDMHRRVLPRAYAAAAVAGAWLVLILAGWWRPERTWIDRFGRTLGFAWLRSKRKIKSMVLILLFL